VLVIVRQQFVSLRHAALGWSASNRSKKNPHYFDKYHRRTCGDMYSRQFTFCLTRIVPARREGHCMPRHVAMGGRERGSE
jgi:hypothetical protein